MTRLGPLTLGLLASTGVLVSVGLLRAGRPGQFALNHDGWQVTATEVVAGIVGATALLRCLAGLQRAWTSRSRHGLAIVSAADRALSTAQLGAGWELEALLTETVESYARAHAPSPAPRPRAVGSTPVVLKRYGTSLGATLVVKEHYVSLRLLTLQHPTSFVTTGTPSDPVLCDRLVRAAVSRAGA